MKLPYQRIECELLQRWGLAFTEPTRRIKSAPSCTRPKMFVPKFQLYASAYDIIEHSIFCKNMNSDNVTYLMGCNEQFARLLGWFLSKSHTSCKLAWNTHCRLEHICSFLVTAAISPLDCHPNLTIVTNFNCYKYSSVYCYNFDKFQFHYVGSIDNCYILGPMNVQTQTIRYGKDAMRPWRTK